MYPNNQPSQLPQQNDPYAFIMDGPAKAPRKIGPSGTKGRIIVVVIGIIFLIIIGVIASSLLSAGSKDQTQRYLEISQRQTEIIRLTTIADKSAKTTKTRSLAVTTRLSIASSQKGINSTLNKRGINEKNLAKSLSASKNSKSDALLSEAEKNNRFDETFTELINNELTSYQKQLSAASSGASKSEKAILEKAFKQVATLQGVAVQKSNTPATTPDPGLVEDAPVEVLEDSASEEDLL